MPQLTKSYFDEIDRLGADSPDQIPLENRLGDYLLVLYLWMPRPP
jgi:hypothetical protein